MDNSHLKSVSLLWTSPNTGATNSSGFTALPAGLRVEIGAFNNIGINTYYWSSTQDLSTSGWSRFLGNISAQSGRYDFSKKLGFSVRCLRN